MATTDKQDELLTQVDEKNNVTGPIPRGQAHNNPDIFYRTVYALVKNSSGEILLQKRSATKDLYPDCWDLSVGGHVVYGSSYIQTVVRELQEELGITASQNELIFKGQVLVTLPYSHEYFHVFEYTIKTTDKISLAQDEVADTKWMKIPDIKASMANNSLKWYPRPLQVIVALY